MNFFDRLQQETETERTALYAAPLVRDGVSGKISKETYLAYLQEAYHHVKHTLTLLMLAGGHMPAGKEWLKPVFAEYIAEETGHEEWILNDIENAGGNREQAAGSHPSLPTELMVAYAYDTVMRRNPVAFFGMVFVLEGTSIALATQAADAIGKSLGLGKNCFSYLLSHGALDMKHMNFFEKTVNRITDSQDQQDIIHTAKVIYRLFTDMFLSIPHRAQMEAA